MPNFKFDNFLEVEIKSQSKPLPGQDNRSSDNYDFRKLQKASCLKWTCPDGISFNVMEDRTAATDSATFSNVSNGTVTPFPNDDQANGLYIANPKNATAEFKINARSYELLLYNWMSSFSDAKSISELSIPGTHDSGATWGISYTGRCQTLSIFDQLYIKGVRFLDIRCRVEGSKLRVCHGVIDQSIYLDDVLDDCRQFFAISPKEAIIMSIKNETDKDNDTFVQLFTNEYYGKQKSLWFVNDSIPNLGAVRGKVVLFRRFETNNPIGINASPSLWKDKATFEITRNMGDKNIKIQDVYYVSDGNDKFNNYIMPLMNESKKKDKWYINFASAINSFLPNAATISNVVNPELDGYLDNKFISGVILMDYIDQDSSGDCLSVSQKIIKSNFY